MTIKTTYRAKAHTGTGTRFVRATPDGYAWCIRGETGYDVEQGTCDASDIPQHIREAADARRGHAFGYVEWPQ